MQEEKALISIEEQKALRDILNVARDFNKINIQNLTVIKSSNPKELSGTEQKIVEGQGDVRESLLESLSTVVQSNSKQNFIERARIKQLDVLDDLIRGYKFVDYYIGMSIQMVKDDYSKNDIVEFFQPATKKAADIRQECDSFSFYLRGLETVINMLNLSILAAFAETAVTAVERKELQPLVSHFNDISHIIDSIKLCRDLLNKLYLQGKEALDKDEYKILEEFKLYLT